MWGAEADWLRTTGPKEQQSGEFPGLSFCLIYPRFGGKEASNPDRPTGTDKKKKKPQQKHVSLAERPGKGHPRKTGNF